MQNWANFLKCFASNVVSSGNIFDLCFARKFWMKMSNIHRHLQFSDVAVGHTKKGRIKCLVRGKRLWLSWYSGFFRQLRSTVWIQSLAKFLNWILFTVNCNYWKDENKEKEAANGPFFKKWYVPQSKQPKNLSSHYGLRLRMKRSNLFFTGRLFVRQRRRCSRRRWRHWPRSKVWRQDWPVERDDRNAHSAFRICRLLPQRLHLRHWWSFWPLKRIN